MGGFVEGRRCGVGRGQAGFIEKCALRLLR